MWSFWSHTQTVPAISRAGIPPISPGPFAPVPIGSTKLMAAMIRAVLDTNLVVAAMLSKRGASNRLLRLVGDSWRSIAISVPLALEYERSLRRSRGDPVAETLLSFLLANASLRRIFFLAVPDASPNCEPVHEDRL
jgi:hypothetical protein